MARLRRNLDTGGDASLQNGLDLCVDQLKSIPPYGHRWGGGGGRGRIDGRAAAPAPLLKFPTKGLGKPTKKARFTGIILVFCRCGARLASPLRPALRFPATKRSFSAAALFHLPLCREVVIMLAALSTCDPGDIMQSIRAAKKHRVRVSGGCRCYL